MMLCVEITTHKLLIRYSQYVLHVHSGSGMSFSIWCLC